MTGSIGVVIPVSNRASIARAVGLANASAGLVTALMPIRLFSGAPLLDGFGAADSGFAALVLASGSFGETVHFIPESRLLVRLSFASFSPSRSLWISLIEASSFDFLALRPSFPSMIFSILAICSLVVIIAS